MMPLWCLLVSLALSEPTVSTNPEVNGQQTGITYLEEKLKSLNIPDFSGSGDYFYIVKVEYRLSGMRITDLGLPQSSLGLVPGTGISLSSGNAYLNLHGDWHVKYLGLIQDSGSFDLTVSGLINVTTAYGIITDCAASLSDFKVNFGERWFYNIIEWCYREDLRRYFEKQICPVARDVGSNLLTSFFDRIASFTWKFWVVFIGIIAIFPTVYCLIGVYKCHRRFGYSPV